MYQEIFMDHSLSTDFATDWTPIICPKVQNARTRIAANLLEISWENVAGAYNGQFVILGSSNGESSAIGSSLFVDKPATGEDSWIFKLASYVNFVRIIFKANGTISGSASAVINFNI